jgi:hypothetical protein
MDLDALTYETITLNGRPWTRWSDGTLLPVARGGDGPSGDGSAGGDGDGSGSGSPGQGDGGGAPGDSGAGGDAGSGDTTADDSATDTKVEFTPEQQRHLAKLITEERAKAKRNAEAAAKKAIDEAAARAKMDETERLKAEKADAEKAAQAATEAANRRLVRSEAKVLAVAEGVDASKADRFVKVLADELDGVEVDDDGEVDAKALKKVISATLKDFPEFKATSNGAGRSGGEHGGDGGKTPAKTLEDAVTAKLGG